MSVGIPHEDIESNDAVILGFMVAIFLKHFRESVTAYHPLVVAHFHEWQAGLNDWERRGMNERGQLQEWGC